jgi:c-di-AMP phosphodiesterase-like protein
MKKDRSVSFTYKLSVVAFIATIVNLVVSVIRGTTQTVDIVLLLAGIFTFAMMKTLWEKEKKDKLIK